MVDNKNWKSIQMLKLKKEYDTTNDLITDLLKIVKQFDPEIKEMRKQK